MADLKAQARAAYTRWAWDEAYEAYRKSAEDDTLEAHDLDQFAEAAFLSGRDLQSFDLLEQAHLAFLAMGNEAGATRTAFWLGLLLMLRAEYGKASGWLSRAQRVQDKILGRTVEKGFLLLPIVEQKLSDGAAAEALDIARDASDLGEQFGDADLIACARHLEGRALIRLGKIEEGLGLLDETMIEMMSGKASPIMSGLIFCSVIDVCQQVYAVGRAREWTEAFSKWCEKQPELVALTGTCHVNRSEVHRLNGSWSEAIASAEHACLRFSEGIDERPPSAAHYQQGEIFRLQGLLDQAEIAFRESSQWGMDPQPGLALLRLAQKNVEAASSSINRALLSTSDPIKRSRLLPAAVEILLETQDLDSAGALCQELDSIATRLGTAVIRGIALQTRGSYQISCGHFQDAVKNLNRASEIWRDVNAPYMEARSRELMGRAFRAMGDEEGSNLEFEAALTVFLKLGAAPDALRIKSLLPNALAAPAGLSPRELDVIRLVAQGKTNKSIAEELYLSEKTVDRHVSNIFAKVEVTSRAAATAFAYENKLV